MNCFKIEKTIYCQGYILSALLFTLCADYIMEINMLDESQAVNKSFVRNINNLSCTDYTIEMAETQ